MRELTMVDALNLMREINPDADCPTCHEQDTGEPLPDGVESTPCLDHVLLEKSWLDEQYEQAMRDELGPPKGDPTVPGAAWP